MNESESRVRRMLEPLSSGLNKLWAMAVDAVRDLRTSGAGKRATTAVHDLRDSEAAKRAATTVHDLRESDAGKRAVNALHDLRESDTGKRAVSAWNDLREKESVRKAEATARRAISDLRNGHDNGGSKSGTTTATKQ